MNGQAICSRAAPAEAPSTSTLHYAGCGCPANWRRGQRLADVVDLLVAHAGRLCEGQLLVPRRKLRVAYMIPHHNTTGGLKCLCEHVRLLRWRGHFVIAVHRSGTACSALPPWSDVEADADVVCRLHQRLSDVYDVHSIDVCVAGIFHQVPECLADVPAPILYWEQGHEWLFGDPVRFQKAHNYHKQDALFHMSMHLPVALAAVSETVRSILMTEFRRTPLLIPNSVDSERFSPGPWEDAGAAAVAKLGRPAANGKSAGRRDAALAADGGGGERARTVLLVGNPSLSLKDFSTAFAALAAVRRSVAFPLRVRWICQQLPTDAQVPALRGSGLEVEFVVSPSQADLPRLYRGHDVFLFSSIYEAWGMPVLEAMACGLPVVTTSCLGVRTFAQAGVNCLMAEPGDVTGLAEHLETVLKDAPLRTRLSLGARKTALHFTPGHVADKLELALYSLTATSAELLQLRLSSQAQAGLHEACAWAAQACAKQPRAQEQRKAQQQLQPQAQEQLQQQAQEQLRQQAQEHLRQQVQQQQRQAQQQALQQLHAQEQKQAQQQAQQQLHAQEQKQAQQQWLQAQAQQQQQQPTQQQQQMQMQPQHQMPQ